MLQFVAARPAEPICLRDSEIALPIIENDLTTQLVNPIIPKFESGSDQLPDNRRASKLSCSYASNGDIFKQSYASIENHCTMEKIMSDGNHQSNHNVNEDVQISSLDASHSSIWLPGTSTSLTMVNGGTPNGTCHLLSQKECNGYVLETQV